MLYRLNVLTLSVPPLRDRQADVGDLARHYLYRHGAGELTQVLGEAALQRLAAHSWPGNDDELRCVIERAVLTAADPPGLTPSVGSAVIATHPGGASPASEASLPLADCSLRGMEEALIRHVLEREKGNRSSVARVLGINRTTLYNKLKLFEIE